MSDTQQRVPWISGTDARVGAIPPRPDPRDRRARCQAKAAQVSAAIEDLVRQQTALPKRDTRARASITGQLALQRQRLMWLRDCGVMPDQELREAHAALTAGLGPDRVAAMREGRLEGFSAVEIAEMARYAILTYALGEG